MLHNLLKPYSALLFLDSKIAGLVLVIITFINPSVGIGGIVAIFSTVAFAQIIGFEKGYLSQGFYIYNSLLVGMGIGYIFLPSLMSISLICIASIFTFMLSFMLNRIFGTYKIPILSLPFAIVTMFVYLASLKYSALLSTLVHNDILYDISLPAEISGFLHSFGTIFFLPNSLAGALIFSLVFFFSRIIATMAVVGFYFGVLIHSYLTGSYTQALNDLYAFNYILVAMALCGVFLLPSVKNFFLALVGVAVSVVLTDAIGVLFNYYAIPVFTLPFNITVISFIFLLGVIGYKEFNYNIKETPEKSFSTYLSSIFRFGKVPIKISLPFSGEWSVYQGFNGEWTHKDRFKYAYDFTKTRDGKTHAKSGDFLEDYYSFKESILSPVSGYVVDYRHNLADNQIG